MREEPHQGEQEGEVRAPYRHSREGQEQQRRLCHQHAPPLPPCLENGSPSKSRDSDQTTRASIKCCGRQRQRPPSTVALLGTGLVLYLAPGWHHTWCRAGVAVGAGLVLC